MPELRELPIRSILSMVALVFAGRLALDWRAVPVQPGTTPPAIETSGPAQDPAPGPRAMERRTALREVSGLINQKRYPKASQRLYVLLEQPDARADGALLLQAAMVAFLQGDELRAWYYSVLARRAGSDLERTLAVNEAQFRIPPAERERKVSELERALADPDRAPLELLREFKGVPWVDQLYAARQNALAATVLERARHELAAALARLSAPHLITAHGIELALIPPGPFQLGDEWGDGEPDEQPPIAATIARAFYLARHEVTQSEWQAVMGSNPSRGARGPDLPVDSVAFADVSEFLRRTGLRLPTEVEWEYAAKAGTSFKFLIGNLPDALDRTAWHCGNAGGAAHPVGTREPNAWGLHDLLGNVSEWCATPYARTLQATLERSSAALTGVPDDAMPAVRGGSWSYEVRPIRVSTRDRLPAHESGTAIGFRVARDVD